MTARQPKPPLIDRVTHETLTAWIVAVAAAKTLDRAILPTMSPAAREDAVEKLNRATVAAKRARAEFAALVDDAAEERS